LGTCPEGTSDGPGVPSLVRPSRDMPENGLLAWPNRMGFFTDLLRSRVLPALVAALGVSFITAGLLTYTSGTDAIDPFATSAITISPDGTSGATDLVPGLSLFPSLAPTDSASQSPLPTIALPPSPTSRAGSSPSAKPTSASKRVATRVVIPALNIDLPVVKPPGGSTTYPLCNVAMYIQNLSQPGLPGATYLYAHARVGMFLPILDASLINNGKSMIGMLVQVYTSDNMYFLYQVAQVRRHQVTLADAITAKDQELWLQTSEGPNGTPGKVQLVALPLSSGPADPADAHPIPRPVVCS